MTSVSRSILRRFRIVYHRARLGRAPGMLGKHLTFQAGDDGLSIRAMSDQVAIEFQQEGSVDADHLTIPAEMLTACQANTDEPVTLTGYGENRVSASWIDGGIPQTVEFDVERSAAVEPISADAYEPNSPELCIALRAAVEVAERERTRYALDCLQLRGTEGKIVVTDGRQVLAQSGFSFPFPENLLVPASPALSCQELYREGPVGVGRADGWIGLRCGPWTIWLRIEQEARFPKVDDLFRQPTAAVSRLMIDPADAEFLARSLDRLPRNIEHHHPITLDLNGQVVLRGRSTTAHAATELVLSRSTYEGETLAIATNRKFLARALELGFREVCLYGPQAPVLCDDGRRQYMWALLSADDIVRSSDDAIRVESETYAAPDPKVSFNRRRRPIAQKTSSKGERFAPAERPQKPRIQSGDVETSTSAIARAMQLRTVLREVSAQASQLVRTLRHDKRQSKLAATTLASLNQLQKLAG